MFDDPLLIIVSMALLGLIPFLAVTATTFVKISVVLFLIRNALGIQQIPPNMTLHALALLLSIYIMAPIGIQSYTLMEQQNVDFSSLDARSLLNTLSNAAGPYRKFLDQHSSAEEKAFFIKTAHTLWPKEYAKNVTADHLLVLIPAFTVSELTSAFKIGFLLYLPFIAIDLVISNILLAMGMMMVSPMTISLPFKLLLFVLLDGWTRLIHGLVLTYQ